MDKGPTSNGGLPQEDVGGRSLPQQTGHCEFMCGCGIHSNPSGNLIPQCTPGTVSLFPGTLYTCAVVSRCLLPNFMNL